MENYAVRSFSGFGTFVFFLYFIKVSSVLSEPTQNIIDVMKNDKELCTMPTFLYENSVAGECHNVTYPEGDYQIANPRDLKILNTFLCLAFYDTWYKVCFNQMQKSFNNVTTFNSHMQTFFPEETQTDQFCENIKDIKFVYKKLKPLLSLAHFNSTHVCYKACFDLSEKFVPLCAILAWSKSIDDNIHLNTEKKLVADLKQNTQEQNLNSALDNTYSETGKETIDNTDKNKVQTGNAKQTDNAKNIMDTLTAQEAPQAKVSKPLVTKSDGQINVSNVTFPLNQQKKVETTVDKSHVSEKLETTSKNDQKPEDSKKLENTDENVSKKLETSSKKDQKLEESKKLENADINVSEKPETLPKNDEKPEDSKKFENTNANIVNNGVEENTNDAKDIEDIKTNTISENTQDHDNSANQDDWTRAEDGKLPNGVNDGPDQSIDAVADQGQNIPEPSEQRDIISHYHGIKTDEESHLFAYFTVVSLSSIVVYIGYHNKQKILAIVLEGRRSRNSRGRRRPSTANYRKLDCTLEEAVTSQCNANVTHVIY